MVPGKYCCTRLIAGFWSVAVSGNWRIVYRFDGGDVFDVDLVDYH